MRIIVLLYILVNYSYSISGQCNGNLIQNPGFALDTVAVNAAGELWEIVDGTPNIENARDSLFLFNGRWNQFPIDSSDNGGNWQNIGILLTRQDTILNTMGDTLFIIEADTLREIFGQNIKLNSSLPHILEFEFTAQITGQNPLRRNGHASVDVLINNEVEFTSKLDTTIFTWEKESFQFVPKEQNIFISFQVNAELNPVGVKLVAIDGICLRPIKLNNSCNCGEDGN